MYSRAKDRPKAPIRLPDHYSGWAFKDLPPTDAEEAPIPHTAPPDIIAAIPAKEPLDAEGSAPPYEGSVSNHTPPKSKPSPAFLQPFEHLLGKAGNTFPFGHGIGFDELLLLGLIVLLAHNDHDPDILLLLALLLFCG